MNADDFIKQSIQLTKNFCHLYMYMKTPEEIEKISLLLDEQLSVIGTGKHEIYHHKQDFIDGLYLSLLEIQDIEFELLNEEYYGIALTDSICVIYGKIWIKEVNDKNKALIVDMDTRFSIVCQNKESAIKIFHIHHSMPYLEQRENEYYPKTLLEKANQALEYSQYLEKIVELDSLTKLYTRIAIETKIEDFIKNHKENYALMVIDVDNFKNMNDNYGHLYGDMVLVDIANLLKDLFQEKAYIGRAGGDEFIIFFHQYLTYQETAHQAYCIIRGCERLSLKHNNNISCSIGISFTTLDSTFSKLYAEADIALYQSKDAGKAQFTFK